MIEQNGSDPAFAKGSKTDAEDIIELTDEAALPPVDDDNAITLTTEAEDEEIIELRDEADLPTEDSLPEQEPAFEFDRTPDAALREESDAGALPDDAIMDLTDEAPPAADSDDILELTETADTSPDADSEEVLDLTDTVEDTDAIDTDEAVLDLTDEAPPAADSDDILELTETADTFSDADSEEVLDLTDTVEDTDAIDTDEAVLDLTDEAPPAADSDDILELTETADTSPDADSEEVLDLTDTVEDTDAIDTDEAVLDLTDEAAVTQPPSFSPSPDEEDLLSMLADTPPAAAATPEAPPEKAELDAAGFQLDPARDLSLGPDSDTIEVELEAPDDPDNTPSDMPVIVIPRAQLEKAIERVVEDRLRDKIDAILTQAIEKAVTGEIQRLKRLIAGETDAE